VPEHDARQGFHLKVPDRRALMFREVADLILREPDVGDVPLGEFGQAVADLAVRQPIVVPVPTVEFLRKLPHGRVAPRRDVGQDAFHGRAHPSVVVGSRRLVASALQEAGHAFSSLHAYA
jgi:hypothetical protein